MIQESAMAIDITQDDPAVEMQALQRRLNTLEEAFRAFVSLVHRSPSLLPDDEREAPIPGWDHLVNRKHPWRRQPYMKDRNMTVRQLVGTIKANRWSDEEAARQVDLPVEAVREALRFAEENQELLAFETAFENWLLESKGVGRDTRPVPR
jgi:uncharacterized protein (DUF433 family)